MKKKSVNDPLADIAGVSAESTDEKKKKGKRIVRVEELQRRLENGETLSEDEIISTYMPARKARLFGASLLRMDKVRIGLLIGVLLLIILFALSFMQEKMGNFTINLDRLELYRKGISISADGNFTQPVSRLVADSVEDATNITWTDIPGDVNDKEGSHNGRNYMAYTYFVRNAGKETVSYNGVIYLEGAAKGADKAVRVAVWRNDELITYAAPSASGKAEDGTVMFENDDIVCRYHEDEFKVGYVDKYTVLIYLEGNDPECVDNIVGGSIQFTMKIEADNEDDSSLIEKFFKDIVDTITGDNPINAAGNEAPDFDGKEITWETRLNK